MPPYYLFAEEYENKADGFWDTFYGQHQNKFFKDRHWLFTEFPELYGRKENNTEQTTAETFFEVMICFFINRWIIFCVFFFSIIKMALLVMYLFYIT